MTQHTTYFGCFYGVSDAMLFADYFYITFFFFQKEIKNSQKRDKEEREREGRVQKSKIRKDQKIVKKNKLRCSFKQKQTLFLRF